MKKSEKQKEDYNILFIIGNGFDKHNGLLTSYQEFLLYYIKNSIKEASKKLVYDDDCIHISHHKNYYLQDHRLELFLKELTIESLSSLLIDMNKSNLSHDKNHLLNREPYFYIETKNFFIQQILKNSYNNNWSGIEKEIYNVLDKEYLKNELSKANYNPSNIKHFKIDSTEIEKMNKSIISLKKSLIQYLQTQNSPSTQENFFNEQKTLDWCWGKDKSPDFTTNVHFLNFNYTTYMDAMLKNLLAKFAVDKYCIPTEINYIHGRLDEKIEDVIFGLGDEEDSLFKQLEAHYPDEWLKPMKSYNYLRKRNYHDLIGFTEQCDYVVYIIGHSCGTTDRTLLKMIFENEKCKKINVMHRGEDSYIKTCYNISRNFSDKIKMRKVLQPYDPKLKF